jgi:hypothetical protein
MKKVLLALSLILLASSAFAGSWTQTTNPATRWILQSEVSQIDTISGTTHATPKTGACTAGETWKYRKLITYTMFTPTRYWLGVYDQTCI